MVKIIFLILLFPTLLLANSTTVFTGTGFVEDNYISDVQENTNYGSADTLRMKWALFDDMYGLIRVINLNDSIPATATVVACTLVIYVEYQDAISGDPNLNFTKLCKDWSESESDWSSSTNSLEWGSTGATNVGSSYILCDSCENSSASSDDVLSQLSSTADITTIGEIKIVVGLCDAQDWVDGSDGDNGLKLRVGTSGDVVTITSSEGTSNQPQWIFVWNPASEGSTNLRHSPDGEALRHSPDGGSVRHGG